MNKSNKKILVASMACQYCGSAFAPKDTRIHEKRCAYKTSNIDYEQRYLQEAKACAIREGVEMVVVYDEIGNAEEETPWGYCPKEAKEIIHRYGVVKYEIDEQGRAFKKN